MLYTLLLLSSLLATADPSFWRYTDKAGVEHLTNDFDSIPPALRESATPVADLSEVVKPADNDAGKAHLDALSAREAEEMLWAGRLTVDDVDYLVKRGVLRSSVAGDSLRNAKTPEQLAAERASRLAALEAASGVHADPRLGTVSLLRAFLYDVKESPKFKWALIGQLALAIGMIVAMPFVMRKYNSDSTRRIIRFSFLMIFGIVSTTGHLLLFRSETEQLFRIMNGAPPVAVAQPE